MGIQKASVRSLFIETQYNGQFISSATAFAATGASGASYLLTNRHNVTGRHWETDEPLSKTAAIPNHVKIFHNQQGKLGSWISTLEPLYDLNESPRWEEHPELGSKADFVALPLSQLKGIQLYPYQIPGADIYVGPADIVSVIGFPFGNAAGGKLGIWATGFLASEPDVDYRDLPIQLIDCRTRQGQSGSPVIALRSGEVVKFRDGSIGMGGGSVERFIGIYSGRINAESDLGMVWKASALVELLNTL